MRNYILALKPDKLSCNPVFDEELKNTLQGIWDNRGFMDYSQLNSLKSFVESPVKRQLLAVNKKK